MATSNSTEESKYIFITQNWSITGKISATICALGTNVSAFTLNSLLLATILFSKSLRRKPDSTLIANLALSDLLVACFIMPLTSFQLISGEIDPQNGLWVFIGFSNFLFCIASILNLAVLSLDQCLSIKCPFWYEVHRTRSKAFAMSLFVWVYSGICALPPLLGISSYPCFIPNTGPCSPFQWSGTNQSVIFTVAVTSASWGLGILIFFTANIIIYLVVIKQRAAIAKTMVHKDNCPKKAASSFRVPTQSTASKSRLLLTAKGKEDGTKDSLSCSLPCNAGCGESSPIKLLRISSSLTPVIEVVNTDVSLTDVDVPCANAPCLDESRDDASNPDVSPVDVSHPDGSPDDDTSHPDVSHADVSHPDGSPDDDTSHPDVSHADVSHPEGSPDDDTSHPDVSHADVSHPEGSRDDDTSHPDVSHADVSHPEGSRDDDTSHPDVSHADVSHPEGSRDDDTSHQHVPCSDGSPAGESQPGVLRADLQHLDVPPCSSISPSDAKHIHMGSWNTRNNSVLYVDNSNSRSSSCRIILHDAEEKRGAEDITIEGTGNTNNNSNNDCNCFPKTKHVKSLLIIVIAYFITWTPFCALLLVEIQQKMKQYTDLSLIFLWIGHMSSFINPALYFYRYNRFRKEAKILWRKIVTVRVVPG